MRRQVCLPSESVFLSPTPPYPSATHNPLWPCSANSHSFFRCHSWNISGSIWARLAPPPALCLPLLSSYGKYVATLNFSIQSMSPISPGTNTVSITIQLRAWHAASAHVHGPGMRPQVGVVFSPLGTESRMLSGSVWNPSAALLSASSILPGLLVALESTKPPKEDAQSY